jgi:hypothetical protein
MLLTPKEKALELVNQMYKVHSGSYSSITMFFAIQCAFITVKEIIKQWEVVDAYLADGQGKLNPNLKYWLEVKIELEKM